MKLYEKLKAFEHELVYRQLSKVAAKNKAARLLADAQKRFDEAGPNDTVSKSNLLFAQRLHEQAIERIK